MQTQINDQVEARSISGLLLARKISANAYSSNFVRLINLKIPWTAYFHFKISFIQTMLATKQSLPWFLLFCIAASLLTSFQNGYNLSIVNQSRVVIVAYSS